MRRNPSRPSGPHVVIGHPRPGAGAPLRAVLEGLGVRGVTLVDRADLDAAVADAPDALLLHAGLPGFGPGLIAGLRGSAALRDVPILALGRFSGARQRQELLRAGASDLLVRPLTLAELSARLGIHLENRKLGRSLQEVIRSLQTYHTGAVQRMALARDMQLGLLPDRAACDALERRYGVALDSHFESSSELGGDIWGARPLDDRRFAVFLCDFTGHGVAAAMNTFRLHALLSKMDLPGDDPAETLRTINGLLVGLLPETQFAAMIYAVVDTGGDELVYATAGAPKPLIGHGDGRLEVGASRGLPLGVASGSCYRNHRMAFPPGAFLFLFSDGLYEARDWEGRLFGYPALTDLVAETQAQRQDAQTRAGPPVSAARPLAGLLDRYFETMPRPLADDLTALWISRRATPPGP